MSNVHDDAELIRLCDQIAAVRNAELSRFNTDENDTETLDWLDTEWRDLSEKIYQQKRPRTREAAEAMARAALLHISKCADGSLAFTDIGEWMAHRITEFLARGALA